MDSEANGTNGIQQVGYGDITGAGNDDHATVWSASAGSAIDLQPLLPSTGTWTDSTAYSIDPAGNIFGTADGTYKGTTGVFAIEWSPVPEPASLALGAMGTAGLLRRRRLDDILSMKR